MQTSFTQEIHGANSFTGMDISTEGDVAVVTGDTVRYLAWNDKTMELIFSASRVSSEVDIEATAPTLQSFHAPEVLSVKFSPATVSPNGRPLLAACTSFGEIFTLRAPQLGVSAPWLLHADLSAAVLQHLKAQPELQQHLAAVQPSSPFVLAHGEDTSAAPASSAADEGHSATSNTAEPKQADPNSSQLPSAAGSRSHELSAVDDARRKVETVEKLKRRLAEAEAASKYAAAMKAIDASGSGNVEAAKDAEEAAAAAQQAAKAVAVATEAADAAVALVKQLTSNPTSNPTSNSTSNSTSEPATPAASAAPVNPLSVLPPPVIHQVSAAQPSPLFPANDLADGDVSGSKRVRSSDGSDGISSTGTPRTPAYVTKTPGYISKIAMDSRVAGASDQLARIIKAMLKLFLSERAKQPQTLQISYGSWNKFSDNDQNLMNSCFERVFESEVACIQSFQLEDVCTTKRLQQHVRIALRKFSDGEYVGDADEVENNLYESAREAASGTAAFTTPNPSHPAFTPGGRTGAGSGVDTPFPSLKKQPVSSLKHVEAKAVDKSQSIGGTRPQNHMLAMQCRSMCVAQRSVYGSSIDPFCMCWTLPVVKAADVDAPAEGAGAAACSVPVSFLFLGLPSMIVVFRFSGCPPPSGNTQCPQTIHSSYLTRSIATRFCATTVF